MIEWLSKTRQWLFRDDVRAGRRKPGALWLGRAVWALGEQFYADHCLRKAAALTYTSILSLFPLLAVLLIFAAHFAGDGSAALESKIVDFFGRYLLPSDIDAEERPLAGEKANPLALPGETAPARTTPEDLEAAAFAPPAAQSVENIPFVQSIISDFHAFRQNAGKIAGFGALGLLVAAVALFMSMEQFFNEIWRAKAKRPFFQTFSAFATVLVCLPALIGAANYAARFMNGRIEQLKGVEGVGWFFAKLAAHGGHLAPFILLSLALATAYFLIPNTRVRFRSALAGGLVAAALWIAAQRCFFLYANASVFYRTVFGAFGATLVFLVWLYVLWAIILIGAEVAYLNQHLGIVLRERYMPLWKTMLDQRLILFVLARIGEAFARGEAGIEFDELRRRTALRDSDLEEIIEQLRQGGYVAGLEDGRLTVSRPLESIALADALGLGCQTAPLADEGNGPMRRALANLDQALPAALQGMSLADWLKPEKADA